MLPAVPSPCRQEKTTGKNSPGRPDTDIFDLYGGVGAGMPVKGGRTQRQFQGITGKWLICGLVNIANVSFSILPLNANGTRSWYSMATAEPKSMPTSKDSKSHIIFLPASQGRQNAKTPVSVHLPGFK
jgi:hypothetical protein